MECKRRRENLTHSSLVLEGVISFPFYSIYTHFRITLFENTKEWLVAVYFSMAYYHSFIDRLQTTRNAGPIPSLILPPLWSHSKLPLRIGHLRFVPCSIGESLHPLSSAFASSSNLSNPRFFSCFYTSVTTQPILEYLDTLSILIENFLTTVRVVTVLPSPFRNLPFRLIGEEEAITCLHTSRWNSYRIFVWEGYILLRNLRAWSVMRMFIRKFGWSANQFRPNWEICFVPVLPKAFM